MKIKKLKYLKKLHDKVLTEKAALKEDAKVYQIARTKYKKIINIFSENKAEQQLVGRNKVHSSIVRCGLLVTTYLWYILLWRAKSKQQKEIRYIIRGEYDYLNFSINYIIRTMCLLSGVLHNTLSCLRLQLLSDRSISR